MPRLLLSLSALALLTGAVPADARQRMVDNVTFEASGDPGWDIEIGDDIGLRLGHEFYGGEIAFTEQRFANDKVLVHDGVRRWRSANGNRSIVIIATPGDCSAADGALYTHAVHVIRSWGEPRFRNLSGCGGRLIRSPDPE